MAAVSGWAHDARVARRPARPAAASFCYPCIAKWSEIENSCPSCRARFGRLRRKRLPPRGALLGVDANGELPGTYLDSHAVEERNQVRGRCRLPSAGPGLEPALGAGPHARMQTATMCPSIQSASYPMSRPCACRSAW